jgi:hypothetical protein
VPNELPHPRVIRHWPWQRTVLGVVAGIITIAVMLIVVEHKESQFAGAADCPSVTTINAALRTNVTRPSAVSEQDLLGCFYPQGSDDQAVSVSFAVPTRSSHPCTGRPALRLAGDVACNETGTAGTSRAGTSVLVEAHHLQFQFTTTLRQVTLGRLEILGARVLSDRPPPVRSVDDPS